MSTQQQFRAMGVALHSHVQSVLATAYLTLYCVRPKLARAALAERRARAARSTGVGAAGAGAAGVEAATPELAHYAALLAVAYVLTPVLAVVSWRSLTPVVSGLAAAGIGACVLVAVPQLVHAAYGATKHALRSFASLLVYTALGGGVGAAIGRALASVSCSAEANDECGLTVLAWLLFGSVAGGLLAYGVHGVRQVRRAARRARGAGSSTSVVSAAHWQPAPPSSQRSLHL